MVRVETTRFGVLHVEPADIITFLEPIIGFEHARRYTVLPTGGGDPLYWLQSIEQPDLAFLMVDPRAIYPSYTLSLSESILGALGATKLQDLTVYTLLVVPKDPTQIRTNLRAPLLINRKTQLGRQIVLEGSDYPIQYFLTPPANPSTDATEVANARPYS
jgi:flagellar assembly factor FliW